MPYFLWWRGEFHKWKCFLADALLLLNLPNLIPLSDFLQNFIFPFSVIHIFANPLFYKNPFLLYNYVGCWLSLSLFSFLGILESTKEPWIIEFPPSSWPQVACAKARFDALPGLRVVLYPSPASSAARGHGNQMSSYHLVPVSQKMLHLEMMFVVFIKKRTRMCQWTRDDNPSLNCRQI